MALDLGLIKINRLVLHKLLPRQNKAPVEPIFGDALIKIDEAGLATLQNRIVKALGSDSHGIQMDIAQANGNSFFSLGAPLMDVADKVFIERSREIVNSLNAAQATRDLPGGALVIMTGVSGNNGHRFIAVIKAEMHDGFDLEEEDGHFVVNYLNSLMLTPSQRFYKIGMLIESQYNAPQDGKRDIADFSAYLYDQQMNANGDKSAAQYFHRTFLGFELLETSKKQTREFYAWSKEFFAGRELDADKKLDLYDSLYVTLKVDQSPTLTLSDYAESYLSFDEDLRDDYLAFMESKGFPSHAIHKDLSLLKSQLRRRKVKFSSDVTISAPAEQFKELVSIDKELSTSSETVVRIKGTLKAEE